MRKCNKCKIEYNGNLTKCPLCQSDLTGKKTPSVFPQLKEQKENILRKLLLFIVVAIVIISIFIEYLVHQRLTATKYIILSLITLYILVIYIIEKYQKPIKMMNRYFIIILILLFIWYLLIKSKVITTFLIPILCIVILLFNSITMIVLKESYINKSFGIILLDCILGLIPLLLNILSLVTTPIIVYICTLLDALIFFALLIFCHENLKEELEKRMNI